MSARSLPSLEQPETLFGIANQSPLWAVRLGRNNGTKVAVGPESVALLLSLGPAGEWTKRDGETGEIIPFSVAAMISESEDSEVQFSGDGDGLVVVFKRALFNETVASFRPGLIAGLRNVIENGLPNGKTQVVSLVTPDAVLTRVVPALEEPPVMGPARSFWYEGQIKSLIALTCFRHGSGGDEFFCSRQKRLSLERVAKAKAWLNERLDSPLNLSALADSIGCSACYLSRTFSVITGLTISQYLRKRRIERAAELLVKGTCNVSEAAVEVGYQSLSHFSKAFLQEKGCLPSKYEAA